MSAVFRGAIHALSRCSAGLRVACHLAESSSESDDEGAGGSKGSGKRNRKDARELNANTQRILRGVPHHPCRLPCMLLRVRHFERRSDRHGRATAETAVRDRIGKGHNPDIAPLSGIVAKLKAQQTALAAKCVPSSVVHRLWRLDSLEADAASAYCWPYHLYALADRLSCR